MEWVAWAGLAECLPVPRHRQRQPHGPPDVERALPERVRVHGLELDPRGDLKAQRLERVSTRGGSSHTFVLAQPKLAQPKF